MYRIRFSAIAVLIMVIVLLLPAAAPALSQPALETPPAPPADDRIPGPRGVGFASADPLQPQIAPRVGARAFDSYAASDAANAWQRWPYGSPDQNFAAMNDVQWTPASAGQPRQAWAVGSDATATRAMAMRWEGQDWQRTPLPPGITTLTAVGPVSPNDVWAAGRAFLHWDGAAWSVAGALGDAHDVVISMQMLSPTLGFAGTFGGYLYTWDGSAWTLGDKISPLDVQTIHMFDARNGWAAGQQGVLLRCQNGVWTRVYAPVSHHFTSMDFVSPNDGWLVGTRGTFLHWDGHAWTPFRVPEASATLRVSMLSPYDGWAVGEQGKIFRWNGRAWTRVEAEGAESFLLMAVAASSSANAFAVGGNGALFRWDGRAWTLVPQYIRAPITINDVRMTAPTDGWAVGGSGLLMRWDGHDWQVQEPLEGNPSLFCVDMFTTQNIWAGGAGVLVYGDVGNEWVQWEVPAIILGLDAMPIENHVFAAGFTPGDDPRGVIYYWTPSGWEPMDMPESPALRGIKMLNGGFGFAVGQEGTILRWNGAERQWTQVDSPTDEDLYGVEFVSQDDWWIIGASGTILHGDGETWTAVESPLPDHLLRTVRMTNFKTGTNSDLWIGGEQGALLHYDWLTRRWEAVPSATANMIFGVGGQHDGTVWAVGEYGAIVFYSPTSAISGRVTDALSGAPLPGIELRAGLGARARTDAAGVYRFTNVPSSTVSITLATPGYTYTPAERVVTVPPDATNIDFTARRANTWKCWPGDEPFACVPNLWAVAGIGDGRAWAVGEGGAIFLWDGARWLRVVSPTELTLTSVSVLSPTDAWAVGGGGTVLHWDGRIWSKVEAGATANLGAVAALAPDNVWIAGQEGLIRHWNGSVWQTVPSNTDDIIRSLSMLSPTEGWAAGGHFDQAGVGYSVLLHWDGQTWNPVFSPVEKPITAISMLSPTLGWASSVDGLARWNGAYWFLDPAIERDIFTSVAMRSPTDGWATGFHNGQPMAAHWNGHTWDITQLGAGFEIDSVAYTRDDEQIVVGLLGVTGRRQGAGDWSMRIPDLGDHGNSVSAINADDIWLGTDSGDVLRWNGSQWLTQAENVAGVAYVVRAYAPDDVWLGAADGFVGHWDGTQWTNVGEPTNKLINNIMKLGPNDVWAAGGRFIKQNEAIFPEPELMHWDGSAWSRPDLGDLKTMFAGMIHFGPNDIWAAGYDGHMLHWDGHTWDATTTIGQHEYILSLAGRAPNDIWGVGVNGRIVHYDGSDWLPAASPTEDQLGGIGILPDGTGWAVGWSIVSFDGQEWHRQPSPTQKLLMGLTLLSDHDGWAVGAEGVKLRLGPSYSARGVVTDANGQPLLGVELYNSQSQVAFTDVDGSYAFDDLAGGSITITPTLQGWTFDPPSRTFSAPPAPEDINFVGRSLSKTFFPLVGTQPAGLVGWAIGNYTDDGGAAIVHTVNGGRLWRPQTTRGQWAGYLGLDISAVDSKTAWVALGGGPEAEPGRILHTNDGGANWTQQTLPAGVHDQVKGIKGLSRDVAWAVTLHGTILHTLNGGATWSVVPHPGITFGEVNRMDAIAPNDVWIVDHTTDDGVVHTADNGVTWRREHLVDVEPGSGPLAINAFSPTVVWASVAGQSDFHRTTDGEHWTRVTPGLAGGNDFDDICAASPAVVFGALNQGGFIGGDIYRVRIRPDGSREVNSFVSTDFVVAGATCMNERAAWVVGNKAMNAPAELPAGVIYHSSDGVNWQPQINLATDVAFWKISMLGARR